MLSRMVARIRRIHLLGPRRALLALTLTSMATPALLASRSAHANLRHDVLSFLNTHTGEVLSVAYRVAGTHVTAALRSIDHLLRDHRTGDAHAIDPALLDQLQQLAQITGTKRPYEVISGFRSERSNLLLQTTGGGGVAKDSLHMQGRAIDIRLADVPLVDLRAAAISMKRGGVGYYPGSNFVHLDSGRVRGWG
jgi:uncharacterized protein YcbK (DUF882 family)